MSSPNKFRKVGKTRALQIGDLLCKGSQSKIFIGLFDKKDVVIKRLEYDNIKEDSKPDGKLTVEVKILRKIEHENIIKYLYTDYDDDFLYIALAKCSLTLQDHIEKKKNECTVSLEPYEILRQTTAGLHYLHCKCLPDNIVHRDLKPSNILFFCHNGVWQVKITDFGISKFLPVDRTSVTSTSKKGTIGFMAPEVLRWGEYRKESDLFSLGIVFFYTLSEGAHPYGSDTLKIEADIRDGQKPSYDALQTKSMTKKLLNTFVLDVDDVTSLVKSMLSHDWKKRPSVEDVLAHHIFWPDDKKLDFLQEVSDYLEDRQKHQRLINKLDKEGKNVTGTNWIDTISEKSPVLKATLEKQNNRGGKKAKNVEESKDETAVEGVSKRTKKVGKPPGMQELLRQIRNWKHHYSDSKTTEEFRKAIGGIPSALLSLFTSSFPKLMTHIYDGMMEKQGEGQPNVPADSEQVSRGNDKIGEDQEDDGKPLLALSEEAVKKKDTPVVQKIVLRDYQKELAQKAVDGHNSLIVAPTGSGKTIVAKEIIEKHLMKSDSKSVIFFTAETTLARQQFDFFSRHIESEDHEKVKMTYIIGDKEMEIPVGQAIKRNRLIVLTPQILIDELRRPLSYISFNNISMMIFDECHKTTKKHPYKIIMDMLMDFLHDNPDSKMQIVGLTASPGVGKGKTREKVMDNLITLLANLNVTICPTTVVTYIDELKQHQNEIKESFVRVEDEVDIFTSKILKAMELIEQKIRDQDVLGTQVKEPPLNKGKQMYENWVIDLIQYSRSQIRDPELSRLITTYAEHLRMYHTLLYYTKHIPNAMDLTDSKMNFNQEGHTMNFLIKINRELRQNQNLAKVPLMHRLFDILKREFRGNPESRCIIFVRRKKVAARLVGEMKENSEFSHLEPKLLTGVREHSNLGGMTKVEQEDSLNAFRDGISKVLVATSVAEEGLDIKACNLVIMYNYVTNEIGRIQRAGRGRAENSRSILIASFDSNHIKQEKDNEICEEASKIAIQDVGDMRLEILALQIKEIQLKHRKERKRETEEKIRKTMEAAKWNLLCGKCKTVITSADNLRHINNQHKVVIDETLFTRIRETPWKQSHELTANVDGVASLFCVRMNCREKLGLTMQCRQSKRYPSLTIKDLVLQNVETEEMRTASTWSKCPFAVSKSIDSDDDDTEKIGVQAEDESYTESPIDFGMIETDFAKSDEISDYVILESLDCNQ